ncbi:MAG TPA: rhodanese-like domain-containing protein [Solirubrobacterales bacterium]|jgi:rhodanese-related sulfurtransferase|nr:rhodanese-like domain-containing protein [Solirubrobacterales bacterium]
MAEQGNEAREVSRDEARKMVEEGAQLVDVRADHEWEAGRIAGAKHVPLPELPQRTSEIEQDRPVVVYCRGGNRSSMAAAALSDAGFEAVKLSEGIVGWDKDDLPLEPESGYVAESGEAAAILQAQKKPSHS